MAENVYYSGGLRRNRPTQRWNNVQVGTAFRSCPMQHAAVYEETALTKLQTMHR